MTVTAMTTHEIYRLDPFLPTHFCCDQGNCQKRAVYIILTTKMSGRSAKGNRKNFCRDHAEKFAKKYGLEMPGGEDGGGVDA